MADGMARHAAGPALQAPVGVELAGGTQRVGKVSKRPGTPPAGGHCSFQISAVSVRHHAVSARESLVAKAYHGQGGRTGVPAVAAQPRTLARGWRRCLRVAEFPAEHPVRRRAHVIVLRPGLVSRDDQVEKHWGTLPLAMCAHAAG